MTSEENTKNKVMSFFKNCWKYLTPLIIGFVIGLVINLPKCSGDPKIIVEYIEKHDTITIEKERIVEKTKIKYVDRIDTFYVKESGDTVILSEFPIEHKIFEDTIEQDSASTEIKIEYSGYAAQIDGVWLQHNYFEKQETIIKEPKKVGLVWAVGIGVGFGGHANINGGTFGYGPEVGIYGVVGIGKQIK